MLFASFVSRGPSAATVRVVILSFFNDTAIPDGPLFSCEFEVQPGASEGVNGLVNQSAVSDADLNDIDAISGNGSITVTAPAAVLSLSTASGPAGGQVQITGTLSGGQNGFAAVAGDISYDASLVQIVRNAPDDVDCTIAAGIGAGTDADKYVDAQILGTEGGIETVRVAVLALENLNPIPDGEVFTCTFSIDAGATEGDVNLALDADAADLAGQDVALGEEDGTITVSSPMPQIVVGDASGAAGTTVTVPVSLTVSAGAVAAGVDIAYDSSLVAVDRDGSNVPNCTIDASIGAGTAAAKELDAEIEAGSGTTEVLHVAVLSFENFSELPAGPLFTCEFTIDGSAPEGVVTLANTPSTSDASSNDLDTDGQDGSITVTP